MGSNIGLHFLLHTTWLSDVTALQPMSRYFPGEKKLFVLFNNDLSTIVRSGNDYKCCIKSTKRAVVTYLRFFLLPPSTKKATNGKKEILNFYDFCCFVVVCLKTLAVFQAIYTVASIFA